MSRGLRTEYSGISGIDERNIDLDHSAEHEKRVGDRHGFLSHTVEVFPRSFPKFSKTTCSSRLNIFRPGKLYDGIAASAASATLVQPRFEFNKRSEFDHTECIALGYTRAGSLLPILRGCRSSKFHAIVIPVNPLAVYF